MDKEIKWQRLDFMCDVYAKTNVFRPKKGFVLFQEYLEQNTPFNIYAWTGVHDSIYGTRIEAKVRIVSLFIQVKLWGFIWR